MKFAVTFYLSFCVVKILFLIQGFSLHKSCQEINFPHFWPVTKLGMLDCERKNLTFVILTYEIVKFSCLLYYNICKPSQAKPSQAKPSQAKPSQAKPSQAKPSQSSN